MWGLIIPLCATLVVQPNYSETVSHEFRKISCDLFGGNASNPYIKTDWHAFGQWLNCKKRKCGTLPSPSLPLLLSPPFLPFPPTFLHPLPCPGRIRIWCISSSKIAPSGNIFGYLSWTEMVHFTNDLRKKTAVSVRSAGVTFWRSKNRRTSPGAFRLNVSTAFGYYIVRFRITFLKK